LAVVCLALGAGAARADIQAKEVAAKEGWADGIHFGEGGGAGRPFVIEVMPKSPAKLAGLREGDEILRIQDAPVHGVHDTVQALNALAGGRIVRIFAERGAVPVSIEFFSPGHPRNAAKAAALKQDAKPAGDGPPSAGTAGAQSQPGDSATAASPARKKRHHHKEKAEQDPAPAAP
jgi:membrane-associated protease RseP (regulator of RpoE activity)